MNQDELGTLFPGKKKKFVNVTFTSAHFGKKVAIFCSQQQQAHVKVLKDEPRTRLSQFSRQQQEVNSNCQT